MGSGSFKLVTPGSAVSHVSAVRHISDWATWPGYIYYDNSFDQLCLFDLILYVPVNNFSFMLGWVFLG